MIHSIDQDRNMSEIFENVRVRSISIEVSNLDISEVISANLLSIDDFANEAN